MSDQQSRIAAAVILDGYIRVSQVRGRSGDSFISPSVQRDQIERWAALRGVQVATFHTDLDQSGAKQHRPALAEALRRVEAGETGGIIVAKLDRFSRSLIGALETIRRLDDADAQFVSVAEGIDPTTPAGKMLQRLMLILAEFELDRVRESWRLAQERAVARGVHIASRPPTGYTRGDDGRLVARPDFALAIADAFRMRATGESWRTLCEHLDAHGVVGPYGASNWQPRAVQHLISNRAYLGEARSGRHVNARGHEPLIDRATWEAAQVARGPSRARSGDPALLAGLLRCAGCRYLMRPDKMTLRSGRRVRIYRCRGQHAAGTCTARPAVLGTVIEPYVESEFFRAVGDLSATASGRSEDAEQAQGALETAEAELTAYRDDERIVGVLGQDRYLEGLQVRVSAVDDARDELGAAAGALGAVGVPQGASLSALWPGLSVAERQRLLSSAIDCVFLRCGRKLPIDRRALLVLRGEAPEDLPRRGRRVPLSPFAWPDLPDEVGVPGA